MNGRSLLPHLAHRDAPRPLPGPGRRRSPALLPAALGLLLAGAAGCGGGVEPAPPREPAPAARGPQAPPEDPFRPTAAGAPPRVVAVDPPAGATGVEPGRRLLSVTFDREMDRSGWAWLHESPGSAPALTGEARFDASGRVNTVEARLEPGRTYVLWINSDEIQHFRDTRGVPAVPFRWTFSTRRGAALAEIPGEAPRVVTLDPPDGATGVDPALGELRVTFDRPMEFGWSWVRESPGTFPETLGDPTFEDGGRTNVLPVRLAPETVYVVWLNSDRFQMFRSAAGVPLAPVRWTFTTGPAR